MTNKDESRKGNVIREEQGTSEEIVNVETCKKFCDETPICQYFFITPDGKCILYQSCKVRYGGDLVKTGLSEYGDTFEKGIIMIISGILLWFKPNLSFKLFAQ